MVAGLHLGFCKLQTVFIYSYLLQSVFPKMNFYLCVSVKGIV